MTCIVGIIDKEKGKVIIGGDSQASNGSHKYPRIDPKVFKNGKFIIGCSGSFRLINIVKHVFTPPEVDESSSLMGYMVSKFVTQLRVLLKENGALITENGEDSLSGDIMVGYNDRLFTIDCDFNVGESRYGFDAIGCGYISALAVMHALSSSTLTPHSKIAEALTISEKMDLGVGGPFVILET